MPDLPAEVVEEAANAGYGAYLASFYRRAPEPGRTLLNGDNPSVDGAWRAASKAVAEVLTEHLQQQCSELPEHTPESED